jgi:hypothetical protein
VPLRALPYGVSKFPSLLILRFPHRRSRLSQVPVEHTEIGRTTWRLVLGCAANFGVLCWCGERRPGQGGSESERGEETPFVPSPIVGGP